MLIDNITIQKIIDEADIVSIIGEYVKLEKKGSNFVGICPFHKDNNPSLSVSPSKKIYRCFSCNESGNVIGFIQKYKNISFPQAVKHVGNIVGINIQLGNEKTNEAFQKLCNITKDATLLYEFYLKNTIEGKNALEYLYNRNIDDDVIKYFHIGLSSKENMIEKSLVEEKKYLPIDLIKVGLLRLNTENKKYYDVFKNRIMFPLDDLYGNTVGFSGRIYDSSLKESKYLNSSDNEIFKKGSLLYNYSRSVHEIKKKDYVFIFEGFMDIIAAYKADVKNTVATMGTALTNNQIDIIKKITNNIILCYDGDIPGIEATKRAIKMFIKADFNVSVIILPDGLDPDDYLNKYGKEKLNELLENGKISCIDYLYEIEKRKLNLSDPLSIENFSKNIFSFLKWFNSETLDASIRNRIASDLNVSIENINNDYNNYQEQIPQEDIYPSEFYPIEPDKKVVEQLKFIKAENEIIYLSFFDKNICKEIENKLPINEYVNIINRNILFKLYDYYNIHDEMQKEIFLRVLNDNEIEQLEQILNPVNFYIIKDINKLINVICEYKFIRLKNELINEINIKNEITEEDLKLIASTKQKITKRKKKKE